MSAAPEAASAAHVALQMRSEELQKRLDPHKELVLLAQDIVCFRRPALSAAYATSIHGLWWFLAVHDRPLMAKFSLLCLAGAAVDGLVRLLRHYGLADHLHLPKPHPPHQPTPHPSLLPTRTLPEIARLGAALDVRLKAAVAWCNEKHENSPGHLTFLLVTFFLAASFVFHFVPTELASYTCALVVLLTPVAERWLPARRACAAAAPYVDGTLGRFVRLTDRLFRHLPDRLVHVDPSAASREAEPETRVDRGWSFLDQRGVDAQRLLPATPPAKVPASVREATPEEQRQGATLEQSDAPRQDTAPSPAASVATDGEDEDGFMHISHADIPRQL